MEDELLVMHWDVYRTHGVGKAHYIFSGWEDTVVWSWGWDCNHSTHGAHYFYRVIKTVVYKYWAMYLPLQ